MMMRSTMPVARRRMPRSFSDAPVLETGGGNTYRLEGFTGRAMIVICAKHRPKEHTDGDRIVVRVLFENRLSRRRRQNIADHRNRFRTTAPGGASTGAVVAA